MVEFSFFPYFILPGSVFWNIQKKIDSYLKEKNDIKCSEQGWLWSYCSFARA